MLLRLLRRLLGLGQEARSPLLQMDEADEAGIRERLWVLRELDGRDLYASLDPETSARLRARQLAAVARSHEPDE